MNYFDTTRPELQFEDKLPIENKIGFSSVILQTIR